MVVDLPAPFGPRSANVSPCSIRNETPARAVWSPYRFVRSCTATAGSPDPIVVMRPSWRCCGSGTAFARLNSGSTDRSMRPDEGSCVATRSSLASPGGRFRARRPPHRACGGPPPGPAPAASRGAARRIRRGGARRRGDRRRRGAARGRSHPRSGADADGDAARRARPPGEHGAVEPSREQSTDPILPAETPPAATPPAPTEFDWSAAEAELIPPRPRDERFDVERPDLRLADVGGMKEVKERIEAAFLAPLRNPELRALYGKSLRGGLLLYGPPGLRQDLPGSGARRRARGGVPVDRHRRRAGQLDRCERAEHRAPFRRGARRCAVRPVHRRAGCTRAAALADARLRAARRGERAAARRWTASAAENDGVFVLAATNQPWDVDPALRRPGRLDRTLLVLPPDAGGARGDPRAPHRRATGRGGRRAPAGGGHGRLLRRGSRARGARAPRRSPCSTACGAGRRGRSVRPISSRRSAPCRPSTSIWLESARTIVEFGEDDGTHTQLKRYLGQRKRGRR